MVSNDFEEDLRDMRYEYERDHGNDESTDEYVEDAGHM